MTHPRSLRYNRSMPHMPHMSEMMSEMMTDMYMDVVIKEHNDPSPSASQEQKASKNTLLDLARKLQAQVFLLEDEIKKVDTERDMSITMSTAAGLIILELRRSADPLVEILSKEEAGETKNVSAGETLEQSRCLSEGQSNSKELGAGH